MPVFAFILFLVYIYSVSRYVPMEQFGAYSGAAWWHFIACHFIHTHILHLAVNSALLLLYWQRVRTTRMGVTLPLIFLSAMSAAFMSAGSLPTIGASALVMATIGMLAALQPLRQRIRIIALILVTSAITGLFAPHVNTPIHVYSFGLSFAASLALRRLGYVRHK